MIFLRILLCIMLLNSQLTLGSNHHTAQKKSNRTFSVTQVAQLIIGTAFVASIATYAIIKSPERDCRLDMQTAEYKLIEELRLSYLAGYQPTGPNDSPFVGENSLYKIYLDGLAQKCGELARSENNLRKNRKKK